MYQNVSRDGQGNFCQKEYNIKINLSNVCNKIPIPNMYQNVSRE